MLRRGGREFGPVKAPNALAAIAVMLCQGTATAAYAQTASPASPGQSLPEVVVQAPAKKPAVRKQAAVRKPSVGRRTAQKPVPGGTGRQVASDSLSITGSQTRQPGAARDSTAPLGGQFPEPETTHQVTQSISVVDRQQIEQTNPVGTLDILNGVPGVAIARAGGIGGQIYLRGCSSNNMRVPLYIDGDRFHGRNTLQFNFFDPDEIERVEVVRGPDSVLYGSDALCGLVNIITRHPTGDPNGPFRFTGGGVSVGFDSVANAFNTYEWAQGAGQGFDVRADIGYRKGGDYSTPQGPAINSAYQSIGGSLIVGYTPDIGQRFELTLRDYSETDGRAGGVGGAPGYPYLNVRQDPDIVRMARLAYTGELDGIFKHVESSIYANYFDTQLLTVNTTSAAKTVISDSHVIGPLVIGGRVLGSTPWDTPWGQVKTTIGADAFKEMRPGSTLSSETTTFNPAGQVTSTSFLPTTQQVPDSSQSNVGAFILNEWTPVKAFTLSAGGRYDFFNTQTELSPLATPKLLPAYQAGSNTDQTAPTGSVGAVLRVLPSLDLLGSIATSFREPTNAELFSSTATMIPNPNLQPEKGLTYEGGFQVHVTDATLKVTAFQSNYQNMVIVTPVNYMGLAGFTQEQNVTRATVTGVELEERWQITPSFNLFNNAGILRGTNTMTGTPLAYIAPLRGHGGIQYAPPDAGYSVEAILDWALAKTRIDPTQEFPTASYAIPAIYATFQLGKLISPQLGDTKLTVGVKNILNASYVDAATFANVAFPSSRTNPLLEPGRNFTMRLTHTF